MTPTFTLLICTRNRADLLSECLRSLAAMTVPPGLYWEILVVDNASTDETPATVASFTEAHPGLTIRFLSESRPGVAYARRLGLRHSRADWVAYIDDDSLLASDWLKEASSFAQIHPDAGAFGGRSHLQWLGETDPPPLAVLYSESLAGQDWGDVPILLPHEGRRCVCGVGLVLRRQAVLESCYLERSLLTGRQGQQLTAGEDTEVQLMVAATGGPLWYAPKLRLLHQIPPDRTELPYLLRLHRGFGLAEPYLRLLEKERPLTFGHRFSTVGWSVEELFAVLRRFWLGYVRYENERPTWLIRLWHAAGLVEGSLRLTLFGRSR